MSDSKFICPFCQQSIAVRADMIGQIIDCPVCNQVVEVLSVSSSKPPPIPHHSQHPLTSSTKQTKRHGVFYYVFFGMISLIGTITLLLCALLFVPIIKGFSSGLNTMFFPPLTEKEAATAANIKKIFIQPTTHLRVLGGFTLVMMQNTEASKNGIVIRKHTPCCILGKKTSRYGCGGKLITAVKVGYL